MNFFVASGFAPEFSWHLPSSAGCFLQVSSKEEGKAPQFPLHPKHRCLFLGFNGLSHTPEDGAVTGEWDGLSRQHSGAAAG